MIDSNPFDPVADEIAEISLPIVHIPHHNYDPGRKAPPLTNTDGNEAAPLSRSGSWVLHDLLTILLIFTLRFPSL